MDQEDARSSNVPRRPKGLFGEHLADTFHLTHSKVLASAPTEEKVFAVTHLRSATGLPDLTKTLITEPALHVSVSLEPMPLGTYQQWFDGKPANVPYIPAYTTSVMDLEAELYCLVLTKFDYMHFYVPKAALRDIAREHGVEQLGEFRFAIGEADLVMAQIAKMLQPSFEEGIQESRLCLDSIGMLLGAHLIQRYAGVAKALRMPRVEKLAPWQKNKVVSIVRENLAGSIRLADISAECRLSPSHFARCFKATFGSSVHQWVIGQRLEFVKIEMSRSQKPLMEIAMNAGFSDQASLTRTFTQVMGISPGRWRRQNAVAH